MLYSWIEWFLTEPMSIVCFVCSNEQFILLISFIFIIVLSQIYLLIYWMNPVTFCICMFCHEYSCTSAATEKNKFILKIKSEILLRRLLSFFSRNKEK